MELLEIIHFLASHISSFPGEVRTVRIIFIFSITKQNWLFFVYNYFFLTNVYVDFYLSEQTTKEKGVYISIHSSWLLICSSIFTSAKSIVKLFPLWDEGTAQETDNRISWNFVSEVFAKELSFLDKGEKCHLQPVSSNSEHPETQVLPVRISGIQHIRQFSTFISVSPAVKWRE